MEGPLSEAFPLQNVPWCQISGISVEELRNGKNWKEGKLSTYEINAVRVVPEVPQSALVFSKDCRK